jgi:hypothetical protein
MSWQPGQSGNPAGRPKKAREVAYLDTFRQVVTPDKWQAIIERAYQDAKKGDAAARKWIADYLIGPPIERKEITGDEGGPLVLKVVYEDKRVEP